MWTRRAAVAVSCAMLVAGCQLKAQPVPPNYITVNPNDFVLKTVQRYDDPNGNLTNSTIVVIAATYTNHEGLPETISAEKFELLDPNLMATYVGLTGGGINVPSMGTTQLDPGKSTDINVGFRVPVAMSTARLVYRP